MTAPLPLGRLVARLADGSSWMSSFAKTRYVRTPAGVRRYGVPIGSPIPIGRRNKRRGSGGGGAGGTPNTPSAPAVPPSPRQDPPEAARPKAGRVPLSEAEKNAARRHFFNPDEDNGARYDDSDNLDVHDPDRAVAALDETLSDPSLPADQLRSTTQLRDKIAKMGEPKPAQDEPGPAAEPDQPPEPDMGYDDAVADYRDRVAGTSTVGERRAVNDYVGMGFHNTNRYLRGEVTNPPQQWKDEEDRKIENMNNVMGKYKTPRPTTVNRYISSQGVPAGLEEGKVVTLPGYTSATMGDTPPSNFANHEAVMRIKVPKGMNAAIPDGLGVGKSGEQEMILPHGTRFKVTKIETRDGKQWIEMTALPPL